jgi:hypothetical protein
MKLLYQHLGITDWKVFLFVLNSSIKLLYLSEAARAFHIKRNDIRLLTVIVKVQNTQLGNSAFRACLTIAVIIH